MLKITIIIPCYNVEQYISQCLNSIIFQTYSHLEVICINDGSTDGTLELLQKFEEKDPRVVLVNQPNQGISASRNQGISKASGDFVMFVDGDDWLELNTLEKLFENHQNEDLIIFSYTREFKNGNIDKDLNLEGRFDSNEIQRKLVGPIGNEIRNLEGIDALAPVWGKIYKKEILSNNVYFYSLEEIGTWEDGFFNLEILENAEAILVVNKPFYHYRKSNSASYTSSYKKNLQEKWLTKFSLLTNFLSAKNKDSFFYTALNNRICITFLGLCLNEKSQNENFYTFQKNIKLLLQNDFYRKAFKKFKLKKLPLHWKVFYFFAKNNNAFGVTLIIYGIDFLINRKN